MKTRSKATADFSDRSDLPHFRGVTEMVLGGCPVCRRSSLPGVDDPAIRFVMIKRATAFTFEALSSAFPAIALLEKSLPEDWCSHPIWKTASP